MPDIFISYSTQDQDFADFLYRHLTDEGLDVFLASVSIEPGQNWSSEIKENLQEAGNIFFLASKAACQSPHALFEVGGSIMLGKTLIPVVWDIPISELPDWLKQYQAIDFSEIAELKGEEIKAKLSPVVGKIKCDKNIGRLILAIFVAGIIYLSLKE